MPDGAGYRVAADLVVVFHLAFILFVLFGAALVLHWRKVAWLHLPCAAWGVLVELTGWICPLTPLENDLRSMAGLGGYGGGFIEHYVVPVVYPPELSRTLQVAAGLAALALNVGAYALLWRRRAR